MATFIFQQGAQVSRLEKADILEMTVKYLRHIQRQQVTAAVTSEPEVVAKFSAGYTECATEVIRYMDSVQCVAPEVRSKLESHLVERLRGSVPSCAPVVSSVAASAAPALCMTSCIDTPVPVVYPRHSSSSSCIPVEMNRHHQTALDLASMAAAAAAAATANEASLPSHETLRPTLQAPSSLPTSAPGAAVSSEVGRDIPSRCMPPVQVYPSVPKIPVSVQLQNRSPDNLRSCEPSVSSSSSISSLSSSSSSSLIYSGCETRYHHTNPSNAKVSFSSPAARRVSVHESNQTIPNFTNSFPNSSLTGHFSKVAGVSGRVDTSVSHRVDTSVSHRVDTSVSDYLNTFQHPLHIQIPATPPPPVTPSPPFLHPHGLVSKHPATSAALSMGAQHSFPEAPPNILYGCEGGEHEGSPLLMRNQFVWRHTPAEALVINSSLHSYNSNNVNIRNNVSSNSSNGYCVKSEGHEPQRQTSVTHRDFFSEDADRTHPTHGQDERVLSSQVTRATPSPPVLVRESACGWDRNNGHFYSHRDDQNLPGGESEFVKYQNSFPAKFHSISHESYAEISLQNDYTNSTEIQHQNTRLHEISDHSLENKVTRLSQFSADLRSSISRQASGGGAMADNGHHLKNGPCLPSASASRRNDTSLSPPTLKKRLLLAQRSEGVWTTPRGNTDKGGFQHDAGLGLSQRGQISLAWRAGQDTQTQLCGEASVSVAGGFFCPALGHVVGAGDDGLWRPW